MNQPTSQSEQQLPLINAETLRPQHVLGLTIENVKRMYAAELQLSGEGGLVLVTGENDNGKSSVLDSVCMALNPDFIPEVPIRAGAEKARIVVTTEDLVITRRFTNKTDTLEVKSRDGKVQRSPAALLESLIAQIGFDPLEFSKLADKQQAAQLLEICPVPLDLAQNAAETAAAYERRTEANREVKREEAYLSGLPQPEANAPQPVDVSALNAQLDELRGRYSAQDAVRTKLPLVAEELTRASNTVNATGDRISELKRQLQEQESKLVEQLQREQQVRTSLEQLQATVAALPNLLPEGAALRQQLADAQSINERAKEAKDRALAISKAQGELDRAKAAQKAASDAYEALVKQRADALQNAQFPFKALSISPEGAVLLNGVPLRQASQAQRIRVGVALAVVANPKIRVAFIREGSLLDKKSLEMLAELAKAHNLQVFVELVESANPAAIHIVNGAVAK